MLIGLLVGCKDGGRKNTSTAIDLHGPHGGHMAEMSEGAGFEMEFTLDERRRRMVIYVLELGFTKPYPLATDALSGKFKFDGRSIDVTFAADARPTDPKGHASRFALALDSLPQQMLVAEQFVLKLSYAAAGETFTGSIPHRNDHAHRYHHD
ncbi:MAG: hypothetical protein AAGD11_07885 [Planctomycetota bacterium]